MAKLNEYLSAQKVNDINVETEFGDLQRRFQQLKADASRQDAERHAMRKALRTAQTQALELQTANHRLEGLLNEVRVEQSKMQTAKQTVLRALGLLDAGNLSQAAGEA